MTNPSSYRSISTFDEESVGVNVKSAGDKPHYGSLLVHKKPSNHVPAIQPNRSSIYIVGLVVFCSDMARGILFPTLWLYNLSNGGSKTTLGMAVAAFSFGRIISSPYFGHMSEHYGYRYTLILCSLILLLGAIIYSLAFIYHMIILGMFIMGLGAGSLGVTRSYVAQCTVKEERTKYMSYLCAVQYFSFGVMPIAGAMLSASISNIRECYDGNLSSSSGGGKSILTSILSSKSLQHLEFASPAYFIALISLLVIFLLYAKFTDLVPESQSEGVLGGDKVEATGKVDLLAIDEEDHNKFQWSQTNVGFRIAVGCCLLNIATKGTIGVLETLGSEFVAVNFDWSTYRIGYTFGVFGSIGVLSLLLLATYHNYFSDIQLVQYGLVLMVAACLLFTTIFFPIVYESCFYLGLTLVYSLGYPVGHTALLGMMSKIVKSGPQGLILSLFGTAGSLSRIIFPLTAGILSQYFGYNCVFLIMAFILLSSILVLLYCKKHIISYMIL